MSSNPIYRRAFLQKLGKVSLGSVVAGGLPTQMAGAREQQKQRKWEPVSERKVRIGIVGYGVLSKNFQSTPICSKFPTIICGH